MLWVMTDSAPDPTVDGPILYRATDGAATITLNMPERKNSLNDELVGNLADRLDEAIADDSVRVVVLSNVGNTFCAGADLKAARPGVSGDRSDGPGGRTFVDVFKLMMSSPKPVIGRIDGHATGGGVGLVAACDISVMRDDAKIGFTEVRLGVAPAVISVVCLPKMRRADAMELFVTGERFTPARAADVGLINRAVPAEHLDREVADLVDKIRRGGPNAVAAAKNLVNTVPSMDDESAFDWTSVHSRELFESDEATAGIAAFRDRKDPPWVRDGPAT